MSAERWRQLRVLYEQVLDAPASDRAGVLAAVKLTHPDLHQQLVDLIDADGTPDSLLDAPAERLLALDLSPGHVLCGRFTIERHIGRGGMGDVWAAHDTLRDARVALKTIRPALAHDERLWARFKREIQLATRVAHPNVCRVHELFEDRSSDPPQLFFTMEMLDGETLAARIERSGSLPTPEALRIVRDVCSGLEAAHAAGVIHRDLKPDNIMLVSRGEGIRAVITDFGLARPDSAAILGDGAGSLAGALVGTPAYMAPEQVRGVAVTPATDIYAVGLLLFEMLRGEPPFRGTSTLDSWMRRAHEGAEPLAGVVPGVTAAIDGVLERCLQYAPERRFQTARELLAAIERRPPPGRWTLAAVAVVVLMVAAAMVWAYRPMTLPREAQQWYDEAQQAVAEGAADRARNAIRRVLDAAPGFPPAHALQAETHLELDMPADAVEDMARASQLVADGARLSRADRLYVTGIHALALRTCEPAIEALRQRMQISHDARAYWMVTAARAMERCNRPDDALATLREAAGLDARNAAIPLRTARPAARRRQYAQAFEALNAADVLFRDRNNVEGRSEVLIRRGELLGEQNRLDEADAALAEASALASTMSDALRQQARIKIQQAIVARKRADMAKAARLAAEARADAQRGGLEPLVVEAMFAAGNINLVQRRFDAAERDLQDALANAQRQRNDESIAGAHLRLASLFAVTAHVPQAEQALSESRTFYEKTGDTRNLGKIANLQGQLAMARADYDGAQQAFRRELDAAARENDPEEGVEARRKLADALAAVADYTKAVGEYRAVVDYYRTKGQPVPDAYARLNLIDTLSRAGRSGEATPEAYAAAAAAAPRADDVQTYAVELQVEDALRRWDNRRALELIREAPVDEMWPVRLGCLAAARSADRQRAMVLCANAATGVEAIRAESARREGYLLLAEAYLWLNRLDQARSAIEHAAALANGDQALELAWRSAALATAIAGSEDRLSAQTAMTRQTERLRLQLGEEFENWFRRGDVKALTQRAQHSERN